ncbi:uncharacterized protein LOC130076899 [Rhinichthys klamathensis goyatoka]|uniref:uncharacterized protein LOC130076899 n=1 Tax=Rhinichthys klamathensis goyatoka TaxID=3034132 RepID=UPI0024B5264C|nr:uncharacterized protein LOC130076899 [Rhinichthys klamathensis goyatoka]
MISGLLLLVLVGSAMAQRDLSVDCGSDGWVTVHWRPGLGFSQTLDQSKALLGTCPPSSLMSEDTLLFRVLVRDCGFIQQVMEGRVTYSNMLIYARRPELPIITQLVKCDYDSPVGEESEFSAEEPDENREQETFNMEIMNPDFSGPAPSLRFGLGSSIPIRATVEPRSHRSLRIYMKSCEFATDADIRRATQVHPIIANAGCLMESKSGNSSFLPRRHSDEMRLYLEAFRFALGQKIFLHCDLEACVVRSLNVDRKACHYVPEKRRWTLLDEPSQSYACACCDSTCPRTGLMIDGVSVHKVLGPLVIVENEPESSGSPDSRASSAHGMSASRVWLLVFVVALALVTVMGVLVISYYLCFWRGGRLGYRPSRDLLTKY